MQFRDLTTGNIVDLDNETAKAAILDTAKFQPVDTTLSIKTIDDKVFDGTPEQVRQAIANEGAELFTKVDEAKEKFEGVGGGLLAGAAGVASGVTLGLSDIALTKLGIVEPSTLEGLKEAHPVANVAGEVTGAVGTAFIPGLNVATGAKLAGGVTKAALSKGVSKAAIRAATGAYAGAVAGVQQTLSEEAVRESPLAIERLAGEGLKNILLGAATGGTMAGAGMLLPKLGKAIYSDVGEATRWALYNLSDKAANNTSKSLKDIAKIVNTGESAEAIRTKLIKEGLFKPNADLPNSSTVLKMTDGDIRRAKFNTAAATLASWTGSDLENTKNLMNSKQFREDAKKDLQGFIAEATKESTEKLKKQIKIKVDEASKEYIKLSKEAIQDVVNKKGGPDQALNYAIDAIFPKSETGNRFMPEMREFLKDKQYSKGIRKRLKDFLDFGDASVEASFSDDTTKITDTLHQVKKFINSDLKRFIKQSKIAGTSNPADEALLEEVKSSYGKILDEFDSNLRHSMEQADTVWTAHKNGLNMLSLITNKDGTINSNKLARVLKNPTKSEELVNGLKGMEIGDTASDISKLTSKINKIRQAQIAANKAESSVMSTLLRSGIGYAIGGPQIASLIAILRQPEIALGVMDKTAAALSRTSSGLGKIPARAYATDQLAFELFNQWKRGNNYEEYLNNLGNIENEVVRLSEQEGLKDQPNLTSAISTDLMGKASVLRNAAPKGSPSKLRPNVFIRPSDEELRKHARLVAALLYPDNAIARSQHSQEYATALQQAYPAHYALLHEQTETVPGMANLGVGAVQSTVYGQPTEAASQGKPTRKGEMEVPTTSTYDVSAGSPGR